MFFRNHKKYTFRMQYNLVGCRAEEYEWASKALTKIYSYVADIANNGEIDRYNTLWGEQHPDVKKLKGALLEEYDAGYEAFMKPYSDDASRIFGLNYATGRIVRMPSLIHALELSADLRSGTLFGVVENFR